MNKPYTKQLIGIDLSPQMIAMAEQKQIMQKTTDLHASIMPLNEKVSAVV